MKKAWTHIMRTRARTLTPTIIKAQQMNIKLLKMLLFNMNHHTVISEKFQETKLISIRRQVMEDSLWKLAPYPLIYKLLIFLQVILNLIEKKIPLAQKNSTCPKKSHLPKIHLFAGQFKFLLLILKS